MTPSATHPASGASSSSSDPAHQVSESSAAGTTTSALADLAAAPVYTWSAPSKIESWSGLVEDVLMQPQPVEKAGMGLGEEGSSMDTKSGSTRKSTTSEPGEDREGHESKRLRLVVGLDVSVVTCDCVYLDVDICGRMRRMISSR